MTLIEFMDERYKNREDKDNMFGVGVSDAESLDNLKRTPKLKLCINYEDGCEEWAGCPCVYYQVRKWGVKNDSKTFKGIIEEF